MAASVGGTLQELAITPTTDSITAKGAGAVLL